MSEITTIPTGWPGFLQTDSGRHRGYGDRYRYNQGISDKDAVFVAQQSTNQNVQDGRLDAVKTDLESRSNIKDAIDAVNLNVSNTSCEVKDKVAESKYDVTNAVKDGDAALAKDICDSRYENLLEAAKNAAAINLNIEKTSAANLLSQAVGFAAVGLDATKNTAAIQLEAVKNASAIAAQLAECCCETKLLFKDQEIRDVQRLLDAANKASTDNSINVILSILTGGVLPAAASRLVK